MGSFGEKMRREREMRGITIEEIAEATKIGSRSLRALEDEHFDQLPGGIFNKGFVRSYAKYLGLDEEQAVADYMSAETTYREAASGLPEIHEEAPKGVSAALPVAIAVILIAAACGFGGWKYYQKRTEEKQIEQQQSELNRAQEAKRVADAAAAAEAQAKVQPPATDPSAPAADSSAAGSTQSPGVTTAAMPGTADTSKSAGKATDATTDGFVVALKAKQDSWLKLSVDGSKSTQETLKASSDRTLRAKSKLVLTLGNVSGVDVSYNGKQIDLSGAGGPVKTLVFTAQGLMADTGRPQ